MSKKRLPYITYQAGDGANEAQPCPRPHPAEATRWRGMIGPGCGPSDTPRRDGHTESARSCGRLDPSGSRGAPGNGHSGGRTGQHLDAVQRRHPASWYPSLIEGLASLHTAVDIHPHGWQRVQVEAAQTVPSGVVAKSALGADPVWEMRVSQFTVPLLQAGQAKHKAMETARKMLDGAISGSVRASDI